MPLDINQIIPISTTGAITGTGNPSTPLDISPGGITLAMLAANAASDGDILVYDATAGAWVTITPSGAGLLSGIAPDTAANLIAGQPYIGEERLVVWATDEQGYYVVDDSGNLSPLGSSATAITYETPAPVSGSVVTITGITAASDVVAIYMDNTFLYPSEYTLGAGQITLLGTPAASSNFFARFNN